MDVKITERGWAGHFCCSKSCLFRRNTLLEYGDKKWIVSTVGNMIDPLTGKLTTIGYERWYETMAFEAIEREGISKPMLVRTYTSLLNVGYMLKQQENYMKNILV